MVNFQLINAVLFLLVFCNNTQQQHQNYIPLIACPNYFQYLHDGSQYIGRISLPNVGNNVDLVVHFSQRTPLHTSFVGRISSESLQPNLYRVEFPSPNEVPKLTKINVNGQDICLSDDYPAPNTRLFLNHNLRTTNRIQTFKQSQTSLRPQTFNQPTTSFRTQTFNQPTTSFRTQTFDTPTTSFRIHTFNQPQISSQSQIFKNLFQETQPDDVGNFISFMGGSPDIYQNPLQSQQVAKPLQQVAKPLQQVTQSPRKPSKVVNSRQPQFKSDYSAAGNFNNSPAQQDIQCGEESSVVGYVVGGDEVSRGQFPWLTAIYHKQAGLHYFCGGTLVSSRTVVSAAHCFRNSYLTADRLVVTLGRHNLEDYSEQGYVTREIQNLIVHPEYNAEVFADADLAILQLKSAVQYTRYIRPICLWTEPSDTNRIVGQMGVVAGWGGDETGRKTTALPKKINSKIVSDTECIHSSQSLISYTSERTFCAGNRDGTGPCIGDSGGGLMMYRNDRWYLRGVVSGGQMKRHTCDLNEFVLFCDVAKHLQWVQSQMIY